MLFRPPDWCRPMVRCTIGYWCHFKALFSRLEVVPGRHILIHSLCFLLHKHKSRLFWVFLAWMCSLAAVSCCTCHYFQRRRNCFESIRRTRPLSTFFTMFAFPSIFFHHNQEGIICLPGKKKKKNGDSPLILV